MHALLEQFKDYHAKLGSAFSSPARPRALSEARLVAFNSTVGDKLGIGETDLQPESNIFQLLAGSQQRAPEHALAMKYAGHQFGHYSPDLGDGRGILLGELPSVSGGLLDIHLKGAGKTAYSRFGDGNAVLRSSIREYLGSIAMKGLGIPTTEALCLIAGNNPVQRETIETAAILTRVTPCHIRFGHFEHFYYTGQKEALKKLTDYVIDRWFASSLDAEDIYADFFASVVESTAQLIAHWQSVGFCHGVMNTDNMSIIGETFDYGPYGFMEIYEPNYICNHSDTQGRYAFSNQPSVALWNLSALAQALVELVDIDALRSLLETFQTSFKASYDGLMAKKLGIQQASEDSALLADNFLHLLEKYRLDYSLSFRALIHIEQGFDTVFETLAQTACDSPENIIGAKKVFNDWYEAWQTLLAKQNREDVADTVRQHNPSIVLRNSVAQQAIDAAKKGDNTVVSTLQVLLEQPYADHSNLDNAKEFTGLPKKDRRNLAVSCSS